MEECGRSDVCDSGVVRHVGRRERNALGDIFLTQKRIRNEDFEIEIFATAAPQ